MSDDQATVFRLNGREVSVGPTEPALLLDALRDGFDLTSVRVTCGIGVCGTCTVLVDGRPMSSCLLLVGMVAGRDVTTAEGLVDGAGRLSPVQQCFADARAFQCSYCIPAMALTVHGILATDKEADVDVVVEALGGNLCRCGSYPQVLEAIQQSVAERDTR